MVFRTVAEQRSNVIVINGTAGGGYGLEDTENGLRYSADEQMYVIYVNNQGRSTTVFDSGLNTVLLPRSVALECVLNYTFADLQNRLSGTVFGGAEVFGGDDSHIVNSRNILMVIYVNLTVFQTNDLLYDLTHNSAGGVIGHHTKVTGDDLYLLHLPTDVLNAVISKGFTSSAFGEGPEVGFQWLMNTIYECLISALTFFIELGSDLIEFGMKLLGELWNLTQDFIDDIEAAIAKIVDAFQAFVAWAVEFIESTISSLMNGMIDGLQQLGNAFCGQMLMTCNGAASDYNSTGAVSQEQMNKIATAVMGTFFITLLVFGSVIIAALVILNVVTNVFSFLVGMVLSTLVTFIVVEVFMSTIEYLQGDSNPTDNFSTFLSSLITSQGGDLNDNYLSAAVDTIIGVFDILSVGILKVSNNAYLAFPMALASSICGLVIAIYADTMASGFGGLLLSVLGLELSAYGLWVSLKGLLKTSVDSNTKTAYGFSVLISLVGTGKGISDVFKSVWGLNDGN